MGKIVNLVFHNSNSSVIEYSVQFFAFLALLLCRIQSTICQLALKGLVQGIGELLLSQEMVTLSLKEWLLQG